MRTAPDPATARVRRRIRHAALLALLVVAGAVGVTGLTPAPDARAANVAFEQCNGHGPGPSGATTVLQCDVTIVNTIDGDTRGSVVTVTRRCAGEPCTGSSSRTSTDIVTRVDQCNGSDNDAAHPIRCSVTVTNRISADTPGARPLSAATVNQCVGSGQGGGGFVRCTPAAATTNATVTQCNGSGNGGGGGVACTVTTASTISAAIPIQVNQCNGTGNPGGSTVTCNTSIRTIITPAASPSPSASPTATATPTRSPSPTRSPFPTATSTRSLSPSPTRRPTRSPSPTSTPHRSRSPRPTESPGPGGGSGNGNGSAGSTGNGSGSGTGSGSGPGSGSGSTSGQVSRVPTGGVQAGGGSTAGIEDPWLFGLGGGLLLVAAGGVVVRSRVGHRT